MTEVVETTRQVVEVITQNVVPPVVVERDTSVQVITLAQQGPPGTPGEAGPRGPSGLTARQHSYSAPYSYCATAPEGTPTSVGEWTIKRIEVSPSGEVVAVTTATGAWDYYTYLTYT